MVKLIFSLVACLLSIGVGNAASFWAGNLEYETIAGGVSVIGVGENAPEDLIIPGEVTDENQQTYEVIAIGSYAFANNADILSMTIPGSVSNIGSNAFLGCGSLKYLEFEPGEDDLYVDCLTVQKGLFYFHYGMFYECPLKEVTIARNMEGSTPDTYYAPFEENPYLKKVIFNEGATISGVEAFMNCKKLEEVVFPETGFTTISESSFMGTALKEISFTSCIKKIEKNAFRDCASLSEITFPENITNVGEFAFVGCSDIYKVSVADSESNDQIYFGSGKSLGYGQFYDSPLKEVYIGRKITSLEYGGLFHAPFNHNRTLLKVEFGERVEDTGKEAFYGCTALKKVVFDGNEISIISDGTFRECSALKEIDIPETVEEIEPNAFRDCTKLDSITFKENLSKVGNAAFTGCTALKTVKILEADEPLHFGGSATMGNGQFYNCISLKEVFIGRPITCPLEGYDYIAPFRNNTSLVKAVYGENISATGEHAFYGCTALKDVVFLGSDVTTIDEGTFYGSGLEEISLPESILEIKKEAFRKCSKLKEITFPQNTTDIERYTFLNCGKLRTVTSESIICPSLDATAFDTDTYNLGTLYVPEESMSAYENAAGWKNFVNKMSGIEEVTNDETDLLGNLIIYRLDGTKVYGEIKDLTTGLYIINGKKVYIEN